MSIRGLAVGLIGLYALASCVEPTTSPVTGPSGAVDAVGFGAGLRRLVAGQFWVLDGHMVLYVLPMREV